MPAIRPVRRSQLISPFGIGAMMDFPRDESLMSAGLDAWPCAKQECPSGSGWLVREDRLEARLGVTHFRMPPDHRESDFNNYFAKQNVPFVRFPRWHYCHNCGGMERLSLFSATPERCQGRRYPHKNCADRQQNKRPFLIPVRFVTACDRGHIQDFPFMEWVHRAKQVKPDCKLRLRAGRSSAGLSGITIECICSERRTLGDVFRFDENDGGPLSKIGCLCKGLRPWFGEEDQGLESCGRHLRVLQRGATNVYFPHVISSIYLPLWAESVDAGILQILEDPEIWSELSRGLVDGRKIDSAKCMGVAAVCKVDSNLLLEAAQRKLEGRLGSGSSSDSLGDEEAFRRSEYMAICDGKVGPQSELYVECTDLARYDADIAKFFSKIHLVHKLRETRALTGFTRILPPDGNLASERLQDLSLDKTIDWLPAIKVYGEGIFLELNLDLLNKWLKGDSERMRKVEDLVQHYNSLRAARQQPHRRITPKFILLHTLAHVMINQLSFDCGYGSASLRERIYCDFNETTNPMQGILIYTASGDSEGTMGGVVRQGKHGKFETTLRRAITHAAWCSSDPVCIEIEGQGPDSANLAACHGCCLLPETSCEEGNRLLDRAMLVGTPKNPAIGFFQSLLGV